MTSPYIESLRSVALTIPDLTKARAFYTDIWHLKVSATAENAIYLRGSGKNHHLLSLHQGETLAIRHITLRATNESALKSILELTPQFGGKVLSELGPDTDPAGGMSITIADPDGRIFKIVLGDKEVDETSTTDMPIRLAHAVLNAQDVSRAQSFLEAVLGFKLSDRTRIMAFMNCNSDHHSLALGDATNNALNHIAFLMEDLDSVMRGGGRMHDANYPIEWGPGRHGPGNNAFNYFIGPFGEVIEYTSDVEQIDDTYQTGTPQDWIWPPGRVDQWGLSNPPSERLKAAQKNVFFTDINGDQQ